jgi:hypothetical protein
VRTLQRLSPIVLLLLPFGALGADIYRAVDANGQVVYSDRPPEGLRAELVAVRTFAPPPPPDRPSPAAGETAAQAPLRAEIPRGPTAEEVAARARNCEIARMNAATVSEDRPLYRNAPNGEREYLSDAEIEEARAKAQSDVAAWCD